MQTRGKKKAAAAAAASESEACARKVGSTSVPYVLASAEAEPLKVGSKNTTVLFQKRCGSIREAFIVEITAESWPKCRKGKERLFHFTERVVNLRGNEALCELAGVPVTGLQERKMYESSIICVV